RAQSGLRDCQLGALVRAAIGSGSSDPEEETMRTFIASETSRAARIMVGTIALLAATIVYTARPTRAQDSPRGPETYTIALFGDMPYNALGKSQYPALLADINAHHVAFSVHDGDLKAGGDGPCADSLYQSALDFFNSLEQPLIFVPGDNDWTDCWGRYGPNTQPFFDPEERLDFERNLFFSTDRSLGQRTLKLTRQADEGYPENQR